MLYANKMIHKIKQKGITESVKSLNSKIIELINESLISFFRLLPSDSSFIVFESEPDLTDNAYALYDHLRVLRDEYKFIWLVDEVRNCKLNNAFQNTVFVAKWPRCIDIKRSYYLATCKWYIYDHCNVLAKHRNKNKQTMIYLSHGVGFKLQKGNTGNKDKSSPNYIISTGYMSSKGLAEYWNEPLEKIIDLGYPRYDYMYENSNVISSKIINEFNLDQYKKIVLWMPTFRQSISKDISEEYIINTTGLPFFQTKDELRAFSNFLKSNSIVLILKLHHLQAELPIYKEKFDNIIVVRDDDLKRINIQLYQFVPIADVLISDYSSISVDYLLLDRPIVYTLDDYEQYDKSRGVMQNAKDYMPGYHVYTSEELMLAIKEVVNGIDNYHDERKRVAELYHTHTDGNSSKRIIDFFKL